MHFFLFLESELQRGAVGTFLDYLKATSQDPKKKTRFVSIYENTDVQSTVQTNKSYLYKEGIHVWIHKFRLNTAEESLKK